jgi:hypothetical protein
MKASIEKYQKALDEFMANEYWRALYEGAPDGAKKWLEAEFHASLSPESRPDGEDPDSHLYKDGLTAKDWKWLAKYDCHHPLQKKYFLKMAEDSAKNDSETKKGETC